MSSTGAVYEIKPFLSAVSAGAQLSGYIRTLNKLDPLHRRWHRGTSDEFLTQPHLIPLQGGNSFAIVGPPIKGVIVYYVVDLNDGLGVLAIAAALSAGQNLAKVAEEIRAAQNIGKVVSIANTASEAAEAEIGLDVGTATELSSLAPTG
jgi:hypothetical protein